jgi:hypothetical protein
MRRGSVKRILEAVPLLAALAAVALLLDGDAVQIVSAILVVVWVFWMIGSRPERKGGDERVSFPMLLVRLLPVFVAGTVAEAIASRQWYPFTFAALAFALLIPWVPVVKAWERRRATREVPGR